MCMCVCPNHAVESCVYMHQFLLSRKLVSIAILSLIKVGVFCGDSNSSPSYTYGDVLPYTGTLVCVCVCVCMHACTHAWCICLRLIIKCITGVTLFWLTKISRNNSMIFWESASIFEDLSGCFRASHCLNIRNSIAMKQSFCSLKGRHLPEHISGVICCEYLTVVSMSYLQATVLYWLEQPKFWRHRCHNCSVNMQVTFCY